MNEDYYKNHEDFDFAGIEAINFYPHPFGLTPTHAENNLFDKSDIIKYELEHGATCGMFVNSDYTRYSILDSPECPYPCQLNAYEHIFDVALFVRNVKISTSELKTKISAQMEKDGINTICILA